MRNFNNSVFTSKKRKTYKAGSVSYSLFRRRPTTAWKVYLQRECYHTRNEDFAKRGERKVNFLHKNCLIQARPGARIAWLGGRNKFGGGTRNLFQCGSNEHGEDQKKKKVFISKISKNSGYRLKILAIFYKLLSEDKKKKITRKDSHPKRCMKPGVSPQKLRKYGRKTPIWES